MSPVVFAMPAFWKRRFSFLDPPLFGSVSTTHPLRYTLMIRFSLFFLFSVALAACAATQMPYHGFADEATLERSDEQVMRQSVNGPLDPMNLAQEDQRYVHDNLA